MKFLQVWIGKPIAASFQLHLLKSFLERFWILFLLFIKRICSSQIARCINWYYISRMPLTKLFLIDNQTIYMSGFFKTVSSLRQNFFACREAFAVHIRAWKGRGSSVKEGMDRKPRGLATSCYHRGAPGIIPWRVGRVTESGPLLSESAYFLCRSALARHTLQAWRPKASQSDTSKVGG